jgi:hypothetical protein
MPGKSNDKHLQNASKLPQAVADHFNLFDTNAVGGAYKLDVLANDKGGNAKHIVSVDGLPQGSTADINDDGTISVHLAVAPGTLETVNFSYTIQLGNGALSTANVEMKVASTESLLENGSFEDSVPPLTHVGWDIVQIPGWSNTGGHGIEVWNPQGQGIYGGVSASDGSYLIETDSDLTQDVISTMKDATTGVHYDLTFDYASRNQTAGANNTTDSFDIWWNGVNVGHFDPSSATAWQHAAIDVVGIAGPDTLQIREAGANDGLGALIDNIKLVVHPDWVV